MVQGPSVAHFGTQKGSQSENYEGIQSIACVLKAHVLCFLCSLDVRTLDCLQSGGFQENFHQSLLSLPSLRGIGLEGNRSGGVEIEETNREWT